MKWKDIGLTEVVIIQLILYVGLWLWSDYVASLLSIVFVPIFFALLLISLISELIERSKVPRKYYYFMISTIIIPIVVALLMKYLFGTIIWQ